MQFDTHSLWIYLYFPQLQLDLIQQTSNMSDQDNPCVVYDAKANTCVQINASASKLGLKHNMGLASASLLCSHLHIHEYQTEIEQNALFKLANQLYLVTSDIAIDAPKGLYLRAQNMLTLYGGLDGYWQVITQVLNKNAYTYHFASAYSVNVAKLMALHQKDQISDKREKIQDMLYQCSLSGTNIDPKDLDKLARVGIKNIQSLFTQPLSRLASRVSKHSLRVISELRGEAPTKLQFYYPKEHYYDYVELLYDIQLVDKLLPVIGNCLHHFENYLLVRNAHTLSLTLCLYQRDHEALTKTINSATPIYRQQDWMVIISLACDKLRFDSAVYAIAISCSKMETINLSESDFFDDKSTHVAALTLLSRLRAKLGETKIKQVYFADDVRPEHSIAASSPKQHSLACIYADRPGLLLAEPIALNEQTVIINGPERIVSGWWDNHPVQRDYFVAENARGQQLWLFKTCREQWFIHGYFI